MIRRRVDDFAGEPDDHGASLCLIPTPACRQYSWTAEAARSQPSPRTLENTDHGTGPAYRKIGARVVYAVSDLNAWADLGTKTSTSDPGIGTVLPAKRHAPIPYAGKERR